VFTTGYDVKMRSTTSGRLGNEIHEIVKTVVIDLFHIGPIPVLLLAEFAFGGWNDLKRIDILPVLQDAQVAELLKRQTT
jgi:hypothetical protein